MRRNLAAGIAYKKVPISSRSFSIFTSFVSKLQFHGKEKMRTAVTFDWYGIHTAGKRSVHITIVKNDCGTIIDVFSEKLMKKF